MELAMFDKHKGSKQNSPQRKEPGVSVDSAASAAMASTTTGKTAMIGSGISIIGDVSSNANLLIEGKVDGKTVMGSHEVEIAQSGQVTAYISGKVIKVSGQVKGDVTGSEKVLVTRTGQVHGNIAAPRVQLEDGAVFKGSIDMNPGDPVTSDLQLSTARDPGKMAAKPQAIGSDTAKKDSGLALKRG
jgi:cytoskeletal protein CcmA (bactofilin family)